MSKLGTRLHSVHGSTSKLRALKRHFHFFTTERQSNAVSSLPSMSEQTSPVPQVSLQAPGQVKKVQKQQQKGHQQGSEFSQQKGRIDLKAVVGATAGRPVATGSAGQNNRQAENPRVDSKHQQVNQAGGAKAQQPHRSAPKAPIRLSLFDHLPRKHVDPNPYSIEGDITSHPATIKLGMQ